MGRSIRNLGRVVAIAAMLTLLLAGSVEHAGARQSGGTGPRATFIRNCEAAGGSIGQVNVEGLKSVSCTHVNGDSIDTLGCDFYAGYIWVCSFSSQPNTKPR